MVRELRKMGAFITDYPEVVSVQGPQQLTGTHFHHDGDPHVAMALTIAALFARSDSEMDDLAIVQSVHPTFVHDLETLGAKFTARNISG